MEFYYIVIATEVHIFIKSNRGNYYRDRRQDVAQEMEGNQATADLMS